MRISLVALGLALTLVAAACSGGEEIAEYPDSILIDTGSIPLAAGEETDKICYSLTLDNEQTLYVQSVAFTAGFGLHHSNWLFADDALFDGPDGVWPCAERQFSAVVAAVSGGVLYAQSTLVREEVMAFAPGAVIVIPPHSRIVGNLHAFNATSESLETNTVLDVELIPQEEVSNYLAPILLEYAPLDIPPRTFSRFTSECALDGVHRGELDRPLDIKIHYLLPHYHGFGEGMKLEVVGGPNDGEVVFENQASIGQPLGRTFDPPFDLTGATGLRFGCLYNNPTDRRIPAGLGNDEMCIYFGFVESELTWGGGALFSAENSVVGSVDGVVENEANCTMLIARAGQ